MQQSSAIFFSIVFSLLEYKVVLDLLGSILCLLLNKKYN